MNLVRTMLVYVGLLGALLSLIGHFAYSSDEITVRMGQGYTNNTYSAVYGVGYTKNFDRIYLAKVEVGFWTDSQANHSDAFLTTVSLGHRFGRLNTLYFELNMGVRIVSHTDSLLSTPFNFVESILIGYKGVGFGVSHTSNAGIRSPNVGRDNLFLSYTLRL